MKNKKPRELRKAYAVFLKPSIKAQGAKLAFKKNVSFSRLIENLLLNEYAKESKSEGTEPLRV